MATAAEIPGYVSQPVILLGAAVLIVPLFKRFKLNSVLGYLAAGMLIGPGVLGLSGTDAESGEQMLHVAELGVVLLLFVIGLELKLSRLWAMRSDIFVLGSAQILLAAIPITAIGLLVFDYRISAAIVAGMGLALSSTALVMQILEERGDMQTAHGRKVFAVLLMQDLAIVPMLAIVALLAPFAENNDQTFWVSMVTMIGAVAFVILAGRYLLNPMFNLLAKYGGREIMTAAALLVVMGAAAIMVLAGLSMAMGAFLAGVLLSESNFRHQLEAEIEPFRGLLLGLFFMAVGMTVDVSVVTENLMLLIVTAFGLVIVKTLSLYLIMRISQSSHDVSIRTACFLAQGGEFGFVLFSAAQTAWVMGSSTASFLIAVVTLSMALTPVLVAFADRMARKPADSFTEDFTDVETGVLMIGFGRFGQIVSQSLLAEGVSVTIIDKNVERIRNASAFGFRIYYGDGTRLDVLRAAGASSAKLICVCVDNERQADKITEIVRAEFPYARLGVRAFDRGHALKLEAMSVDFEVRETFESAVLFGRKALEQMDVDPEEIDMVIEDVRLRDQERLVMQRTGGIEAGLDRLRVKPEPLIPPKQKSKALTPETEAVSKTAKS